MIGFVEQIQAQVVKKLVRFVRQSREQLHVARATVRVPYRLVKFGRRSRHRWLVTRNTFRYHLEIWTGKVPHLRNDRTAYVIGLFGSGRVYINQLMSLNIGERAKYFRDEIRFHRGPTSIIYSGHATISYVSQFQVPPTETSRILEAVKLGLADLIFIYRHPLDSLLTNWVWWRTYICDNVMISGISRAYKNTDDLCVDLEKNFCEFKAFAEGDRAFVAPVPGPRFLSFPEFVKETELFLPYATLALRLEDFTLDPLKEFSKIVEVMSVDLDLSRLHLAPPRSKPYRYLAVKEKVPRFRDFINGLDSETKRRIEKIGYNV